MHRSANDSTYRIREAARALGLGERHLRRQLDQLGAFQPDGTTGRRRANPAWIRDGLLVERQEQFNHPHVGLQWYVRVEITTAGVEHLRQQLSNAA
ncbi:phage antirepressor KilAC domain-containing protein [Alcanivorax sp. ZXX171]|nr:phage antirepressor KilAC domain-containing protein [Alcanivorax sp. ZXX171]